MDRKILQDIKKNQIHPVYFLYGEEEFLLEETLDWIRQQLCERSTGDREWNEVVFDLDETPIQSVLQELETPSFFGDRRWIIARNASFFGNHKSKVEHDTDEFLEYIKDLHPDNILILTMSGSSLDKRKKVVKQIEKVAKILKFEHLEGPELQRFVAKRFQLLQVQADTEVINRLIELVGNQLRLLAQECQKVALFAGKQGVITLEQVDQQVVRTLEQDVFRLTDQMGKHNKENAIQIYRDLVFQKEDPIKILALITRQFRIMLQGKLLAQTGKNEKEIASLLKLHPYPVKLALQRGNSYSEEQLQTLLEQAIETDQAIKSNRVIDKEFAVERILLIL
ncbi:DNA polymerase-3 subunit delta [Croceifilum oryzae]|uniref:DNA polymerase III subunit delta n=1 Tax=Croceifilum oryzae TaxID=1553429 RepID=A0AAJ1TKG1_9BACL|nr:DNA polymerase III subunit delta [Croceifilum oryzae]MDQ0416220.1 DNA polymerase-3 subunit delta [Croceifilum oryzae]